jgi:hypothetical protein
MKNAMSFLAGLLLAGSLVNGAMAAEGIIEKVPDTSGSYCHEKFPAIQERTLGTDHPTLKGSTTGDVIDFYGPCDEDPVGKDQVSQQRLDARHRFANDYED